MWVGHFDERPGQIQESVELGLDGLAGLTVEERSDEEAVTRLERTLACAGLMVGGTAGELLSESAFTQLSSALIRVHSDPATAAANAVAWADAVLDALALLPARSDGAEVAQAAREAAANYQRSVQQRLRALHDDIGEADQSVSAVRSAVDEAAKTLKVEMDAVAAAFEAKLAAQDAALSKERSAIESVKTDHAETFRAAQAERDTKFGDMLSEAKGDLSELLEDAAASVAARVAEIERMERESADLVGAIGLAGTAERYGEEVQEQRAAADFWRWCTVASVAAAVIGLGLVVFTLGDDPAWEELLGKLAASLLLGGVATYAARQSARHRHREEHARALQLELTAFGPFIEPLIAEQREEERVIMTRKTFGKASASAPAAHEEPGPAPLSFLLRRKEKESE